MYCPTCKESFPNGAFCARDGTALVATALASLVGQVLADRYRIVRLLGEGGMGQVYEAQHLNINKRFAIKMLRPEVIGSPQSLQRFRQEAWAASSIGHENIVEIDDFATLPSGQVYLAMEFLDGQSLAERIRDGQPLAQADAVAVMIAVAHGLAAAHDKGIVHRDMKPENIFLARKGGRAVAKILDFGIAKMTGSEESAHLTRTGAIFGTPLYMSPEQAKGKPADARADVYAVGVILYELLTGSVPFGGESSVEILSQHIGALPLPLSQVAADRAIAPALEELVLRALEKEPAARLSSMAELAQGLEAVAATLPQPDLANLVTAPPAPPTGWNAQLATPGLGAGVTRPRPAARTPSGAGASAAAGRSSGTGASVAAGRSSGAGASAVAGTPSGAGASAAAGTPSGAGASAAARRPSGAGASAAAGRPSGAGASAAVDTPSGAGASAAAPKGALPSRPVISQPSLQTATALAQPASQRARHLLLALAALVFVAGGALLLLWRGASPTQIAKSPPPPEPLPPPASKSKVEVIVDSTPTGATIVRDGVIVAETPEVLELSGPATFVLRKEGYTDKSVPIDPAATHKIVVKLDRARMVTAKSQLAAKLESKAPSKPEPPAKAEPRAPSKPEPPKPPAKVATVTQTAGEPVDPYPTPEPKLTPPEPKLAPKSHDELSGRLDKQGGSAVPGGHRVGTIYRGAAAKEGGRSDWFVELDGGRCYTFVGEGGDGVKKLYLYLWGPAGHRLQSTRQDTPHAKMSYCTSFRGAYHLQAKVDDGQGEYRFGIYTR